MTSSTHRGPMRVLIVLTYFRPHVSGLTIYVERLARQLVADGHSVTVLTSRHRRDLARTETVEGVRIVRVPVLGRVSKGALTPMVLWSVGEVRRHDVVSIHLPNVDGAGVAWWGRLWRRPTVSTYHCDLRLPSGVINRLADAVVFAINYLTLRASHRVIAYTQDYADHSPLLRRFPGKLRVIPPPVVMAPPAADDVARMREVHSLGPGPTVGLAARFATEKGIEHLLDAIDELEQRFPAVQVVFAGPYIGVDGEAAYWERLRPRIEALGRRWVFAGLLDATQMPAFYGALDVLVVSSVNSTESFGLVQVEAMLCGVPVVATDLPGVRQPVTMTGMGVVVRAADGRALADGIVEVLDRRERYLRPREEIAARFDLASTVTSYVEMFHSLADGRPGERTNAR